MAASDAEMQGDEETRVNCENCGHRYDPNRTGWKCPACGWKDHCCDGVC